MDENEEKKPKKIYYVGFNYDYTYFSIGTDIGFQIFETNPLNLTISRELNGGIGLVNILEKTNIFFLVGGGKYPRFTPNKLIIWDDDKSEIAKEFRCNSFIINCYIKQNCIFIICSDSITLVNTKIMKVIRYINTINNPKGISSISNDPKKYIFTFPDKDKGNIIILKIIELENDNSEKIKKIEQLDNKDIVIKNAHKGNISVLSLNYDGSKLASTSDRGTIVRIFNTQTKSQIGEYRRGNTDANIFSLSFSYDSSLLGLTSDHGSCHIFSLKISKSNENKDKKKTSSGVMGYLTGSFSFGVGKKISNALTVGQEYSWKKFEIPHKERSFIGFIKDDNNSVYIIDKSGNYISANLMSEQTPKITKKINLLV
jgi:WD40 repeat protein